MLFRAPVADPAKKLLLVIYPHGNSVLTRAHLGLADAFAKPEKLRILDGRLRHICASEEEPRLFAPGIPVAGGANVAVARNLRAIPLWIFTAIR